MTRYKTVVYRVPSGTVTVRNLDELIDCNFLFIFCFLKLGLDYSIHRNIISMYIINFQIIVNLNLTFIFYKIFEEISYTYDLTMGFVGVVQLLMSWYLHFIISNAIEESHLHAYTFMKKFFVYFSKILPALPP